MAPLRLNVLNFIFYPGCFYNSKTDIIFLLDGSGSIRSADFVRMTDFVQTIVGGFEIGHDSSRFGVIVFSRSTSIAVPLNNAFTKDHLLDKIKDISQPRGTTATHKGLQEVKRMCMYILFGALSK